MKKVLLVGVSLVALAGAAATSADAAVFGYTGGVVDYTVPHSGIWDVTAAGAQGGGSSGGTGGLGAVIGGDVFLHGGTVLTIAVGGQGASGNFGTIFGGGGGAGFSYANGGGRSNRT
jgi:hypothetical protein